MKLGLQYLNLVCKKLHFGIELGLQVQDLILCLRFLCFFFSVDGIVNLIEPNNLMKLNEINRK